MNISAHLWFFLAVGASVCWGFGYMLSERIFKLGVSPYLFLSCMVAGQIVAYPLFFYFTQGNARDQLELLKSPTVFFFVLGAIIAFILGNAFVFSSIQMKNASLSSLIEIAYPFLVVIFSLIFFKENHMNFYTWVGGVLIFSGVSLILLKS